MENSLNMKKVSIIVPVKNCRLTIKNLLDSLMKLDYPKDKIEIIVVDGNSTDGTKEILKNYPVKILEEPGLGLNYARNFGFKKSTGEIIAFTDGDCIVPKEWIRNILKNFEDSLVGVVGGTIVTGNPENIYARYIYGSIIPVMPIFKKRLIFKQIKLPHYPIGCNMAFKRKALELINGFDESFKTGFDEVDTLERIGKETDFKIVCDPKVYVIHFHRSSLKDFLKQQFRYGLGESLFRKKHPKSQITKTLSITMSFYLFFLMIMFISFILSIFYQELLKFIAIGYGTLYLGTLFLYLPKLKKIHWLDIFIFPILDFLRLGALFLGDLMFSLTHNSFFKSLKNSFHTSRFLH